MGLFGNTRERNRKKAEKFYEDAIACYEGIEIERDVIQAVACFRQAAERDHVEACRALGWMYLYEEEIDRNVDEAVRWYEKGVELGDMECAFNLAVVYCNEPEVQNYELAFGLFCKVADKGDANAAYYRACFLRDGVGTEKREEDAVRWFEKAHQVGQPDAAEELACLWENRTMDLDGESETDCRRGAKYLHAAARWHEKAAQIAGDADTQYARRSRAEECRQAAEEFKQRAERIRRQIQDAWLSIPEPKQAYRIMLGADYDQGGRTVMEFLKKFTDGFISSTEGAREDYHFFWFDNNGKCVEIICYYRLTKALEELQQERFVPDRFIPLIPCDMGLTELVRMCMEACWEAECYSILPIMTSKLTEDWDDQELVRLFEMDLRSFAKGNGAEDGAMLYRACLKEGEEIDSWCAAVFEPAVSWWKVPDGVKQRREAEAREEQIEAGTSEDEDSEETETDSAITDAGVETVQIYTTEESDMDVAVEVDTEDEEVSGELAKFVCEALEEEE